MREIIFKLRQNLAQLITIKDFHIFFSVIDATFMDKINHLC